MMKKILPTVTILLCITAALNAQPANDDPCNAITLTVAPNLEECTPAQTIQWTAATATNVSNPACGSGQLQDVWYKFVAPINGKVNIRVSLPAGATNDGAMAVYSAAVCNGGFTEISCNDDYNGLNPGLSLTGLIAGQIYYLRFWTIPSSGNNPGNGNYSICLSNPAPPPPPIDPDKRVGINYEFPETNLDVNGNVTVRGGNPQSGRVLTSINDKGKAEWRDFQQVSQKKLFKVGLSQNQAGSSNPLRVQFNKIEYNVGNIYDTTLRRCLINDSIGSVYQFNLTTITTGGNSVYFYVLQNNQLKHIFRSNINLLTTTFIFELRCETTQDDIYITASSGLAGGSFEIQTVYSVVVPPQNGTGTFFSGQKIY